jgi:DNA-binding NarL/FixJ family response regulator
VTQAEQTAAALGLVGRIAAARLARARLELERRPQVAARLAARAAEEHEEIGRVADVGRATCLAGQAHAILGNRRKAVALLRRAHSLLAACGAERHRDVSARELRRLGQSVSRPPERGTASSGVAGLSRREREVAELVVHGLTNERIAEEMFVSSKTVEDHLRRAFGKLGVSSRSALAAAVAAERLDAER